MDNVNWIVGSDTWRNQQPQGIVAGQQGPSTIGRQIVAAGTRHAVDPDTGIAACGHQPAHMFEERWPGSLSGACEQCLAITENT